MGAHKGNIPWNKGKTQKDETKEKIRNSLKGRIKSKRIEKICPLCNNKFIVIWFSKKKYCSKECLKQSKINTHGIISIDVQGYKEIYEGNGKFKLLHRKNMEAHLGRRLKSNEIIHHINNNKFDNRMENLQLMTNSEHSRLHKQQRKLLNQKIILCDNCKKEIYTSNKVYERQKRYGQKNWTCSKQCLGRMNSKNFLGYNNYTKSPCGSGRSTAPVFQ